MDQRAHGTSTALTGSREIAAGVGPAHRNGEVATLRAVWLMMCRPAGHRTPPRLAAACEHLDHDHAAAAARAWARQHTWRVRGDIRLLLRVAGRRSDVEECAGCRDVLGAVGVGEEPVVADAVEALGQHVHQETSYELVRVKPHGLPTTRARGAVVLPPGRNRAVVGCNEAAVRDGDAMGVTGEIAQHLLGPCEWRFAIDYPLDAPQR